MLGNIWEGRRVYLVTGYTDMRKAIDGLATIVQGVLEMNPDEKSLFLFCGKRSDRIKGLIREKDGFLLLYKRLDDGRFQWPRDETQAKELTEQQIRWLLEGLSVEQKTSIRESSVGAVY